MGRFRKRTESQLAPGTRLPTGYRHALPPPLGAGNDCRERSGRQEFEHRRCGGGGRRPGGVGVTGIALWSRDRGGGLLPRRTSFFSCSLRSPLETLRVSHAHSVRTSTPHGFSCSAPPEHRTRTSGAQARFARTPCQPHSEDLRSSRFRFRSHSEPLQISRTPVSHLRCSRSSSSELSRPADSRSPNGGKRLAEGQKLEHHQVRSHHGPAYW